MSSGGFAPARKQPLIGPHMYRRLVVVNLVPDCIRSLRRCSYGQNQGKAGNAEM